MKDKQYQMLQKIPKENSKAICLIHEQKLLMTFDMAAVERESVGSIKANPFSRLINPGLQQWSFITEIFQPLNIKNTYYQMALSDKVQRGIKQPAHMQSKFQCAKGYKSKVASTK